MNTGKKEMLIAFCRTSPTTLYTSMEVAALVHDPRSSKDKQRALAKKIWQTISRRDWHDLCSWPDNCEVTDTGFPKLIHRQKKSKIQLLDGQKYPRWQGNTLCSILTDDEKLWIEQYRLCELLRARVKSKKLLEKRATRKKVLSYVVATFLGLCVFMYLHFKMRDANETGVAIKYNDPRPVVTSFDELEFKEVSYSEPIP